MGLEVAGGIECGLHAIERLMRRGGLRARSRRRRPPSDLGDRSTATTSTNVLERRFEASAPSREWVADFSRRVVCWSMSAAMTAELVTDALVMAIWRRGRPRALLHHCDRGSQTSGLGRHRRRSGRPSRASLPDRPQAKRPQKERQPLRRPPLFGSGQAPGPGGPAHRAAAAREKICHLLDLARVVPSAVRREDVARHEVSHVHAMDGAG